MRVLKSSTMMLSGITTLRCVQCDDYSCLLSGVQGVNCCMMQEVKCCVMFNPSWVCGSNVFSKTLRSAD